MTEQLPTGYKILSNNIGYVILREDLSPDLPDILFGLLSNSISNQLIPLSGGRNNIFLFKLSTNSSALIKQYSHGGISGRIFPQYYFFSNRFLHEFYIYINILKNILPVPEYLGGYWSKKLGLYKCGIITEYIPDTYTLEEFLNNNFFSVEEKYDILIKCGKIIKNMHDIGIFHNDLQIRNLIISSTNKSVFLIDFDNAKQIPIFNNYYRSQNLLRLKRSFIKRGISTNFFNTLLNGYAISNLSFLARLFSYPHIQWVSYKNRYIAKNS